MRKSFSIFVVAALGTFTVLTTSAQKSSSFAGTVKFSVKYEGNTNPKDHSPHEQLYTIFGNKIKVVIPPWVVQILDGDAVKAIVLYDIPGNKCGYRMGKEQFETEQEKNNYTYVKGEETKTICGYVCTRYDVTIYDTEEDEETKGFVYTTTEIGESSDINNFEYPGLTGFPLYAEMTAPNGVKTIEEAIMVKPTKVKGVDFLEPAGYKMFPSQMEWGLYMRAWQDGMKK